MDTARIDFTINQGEDWSVQIVFTDEQDNAMNLASPFRMDIRDTIGTIIVSLATSDDAPDFGALPEIMLSSAVGLVQLHLEDTVTNALPTGQFVYDLFGHVDDDDEYAGDQVVRFCTGNVTVVKRITETF